MAMNRSEWWRNALTSSSTRSGLLTAIGGLVVMGTLFGAVASESRQVSRVLDETAEITDSAGTDAEFLLVSAEGTAEDIQIVEELPYTLAKPEGSAEAGNQAVKTDNRASSDSQVASLVVDDRPMFDGRPIRPVKTVKMVVTAYSPDYRSCPGTDDGITASGLSVDTNAGFMVAADRKYRFGTLVSVPGYANGQPVPVLDRGGAIKGNRLDVLYPTHAQARSWGKKRLTVTVWEYAD